MQGFFGHLLAGKSFRKADPAKGRFRSFLLASLNYFAADEWDRAHARKRGGRGEIVSLDAQDAETRYRLEPIDLSDPEKLFERRWAMTILNQVFTHLEKEYDQPGRKQLLPELQRFLLGEADQSSYREVALRLGMSEGAVKMAALRLRERYRKLFRQIVAHTVASPDGIEDELRYLHSVIARPS